MAGIDGDYVRIHARRDVDGVTFRVEGLDKVLRADLVTLRMEQDMLPGKLIEWTVEPHPRPWQGDTPGANVPGRHNPT